jgi:hypothetical protein
VTTSLFYLLQGKVHKEAWEWKYWLDHWAVSVTNDEMCYQILWFFFFSYNITLIFSR